MISRPGGAAATWIQHNRYFSQAQRFRRPSGAVYAGWNRFLGLKPQATCRRPAGAF